MPAASGAYGRPEEEVRVISRSCFLSARLSISPHDGISATSSSVTRITAGCCKPAQGLCRGLLTAIAAERPAGCRAFTVSCPELVWPISQPGWRRATMRGVFLCALYALLVSSLYTSKASARPIKLLIGVWHISVAMLPLACRHCCK